MIKCIQFSSPLFFTSYVCVNGMKKKANDVKMKQFSFFIGLSQRQVLKQNEERNVYYQTC